LIDSLDRCWACLAVAKGNQSRASTDRQISSPRDRSSFAATGERPANGRRSETDLRLGLGKPTSTTLRGRNVASLAAATPVLPTPWPLVPREPTGLQNGGRALLTVGPRRCAALRPVGSAAGADDTPGEEPGAATVRAAGRAGLTTRPPAIAARRQRGRCMLVRIAHFRAPRWPSLRVVRGPDGQSLPRPALPHWKYNASSGRAIGECRRSTTVHTKTIEPCISALCAGAMTDLRRVYFEPAVHS
jgi:hypothetical protein